MSGYEESISALKQQLQVSIDNCSDQTFQIQQLTRELGEYKRKVKLL